MVFILIDKSSLDLICGDASKDKVPMGNLLWLLLLLQKSFL